MPGTDLDLLAEAARAAGEVAMGYFRRDPESWDKGGGEGPVSEADLAVNRLLERALRAARPGYGWISEESAAADTDAEAVFIVDPIDGTRAFLDGTSAFSHAIAVVRGGVPVAGVVYLPAQDKMFAAQAGGGATLNGARIAGDGSIGAILATRKTMAAENWPGGMPMQRPSFRPSLAYRMCLVAQGRFDAMVTFRPAWEWDIAAGALIAAEAGCLVTDAAGGPLRFATRDLRAPGCLVAMPEVHADLLTRAGQG